MNEELVEKCRLTDEEISDIWHTFDSSNSNDGSWNYRLKILRQIARRAEAETLKEGYRSVLVHREVNDEY